MKYKLSEISNYVIDKIDVEAINISQYISTENMLEGKKGITTIEKLPNVKRVTAFKKRDILISNIRPYFKKIWFAEFDGGCSSDVLVFRASDIVTSEFLFTLLLQDTFFGQMVLSSKGTKMPRGDKKAIMNLEFHIPNVIIQNKISQVLFNIKEKIELNNQMIDTLEEMASTLFKRWFVDFEFPDENGNPYKSSGGKMIDSELGEIPEGWKVKKIKDSNILVSDHVANGSFKSLKENVTILTEKSFALFLRNTDLKKNLDGELKYVDEAAYLFLKKTQLFGGEVIISNVGDVGTVHLVPELSEHMVLGNNQIFLNSKSKAFNIYLFNLFKHRIGQHMLSEITSGSVQMKFNKTDFRNINLIFPSEENLEELTVIQNKIQKLLSENKSLFKIRDILLPKLLSGEIEV